MSHHKPLSRKQIVAADENWRQLESLYLKDRLTPEEKKHFETVSKQHQKQKEKRALRWTSFLFRMEHHSRYKGVYSPLRKNDTIK